MKTVNGTYTNGAIVPDQPVDWPEGCRVQIEPVTDTDGIALREEDWPTTPEEIAAHIARMESFEPVVLTPEDEAEWQAAREAQKQFEKATFEERTRKIEKLFE